MMGGDHGIGAFIAGAKVVVVLQDESFTFKVSVAEILCRKDNAEILSLTRLTAGLRELATTALVVSIDNNNRGKVLCRCGLQPQLVCSG